MKCKKYEEKIILNLYGELSEKERAELKIHINECPECTRDLAYTKKVFKALDDAKEEMPEANWKKCWKKIEPSFHTKTRKQKSFFSFPRWAYASAAMLLIFIMGIIIGRLWFFPSQELTLQATESENFIQYTLNEHFEDLKPVLIEYANYTASEKGEDSIIMDKEVARNLLLENLLLKSIVAKTNPSAAELLEDVDIVLREIANFKSEDKQTPSLIKELIHKRGILFKMEILQTI